MKISLMLLCILSVGSLADEVDIVSALQSEEQEIDFQSVRFLMKTETVGGRFFAEHKTIDINYVSKRNEGVFLGYAKNDVAGPFFFKQIPKRLVYKDVSSFKDIDEAVLQLGAPGRRSKRYARWAFFSIKDKQVRLMFLELSLQKEGNVTGFRYGVNVKG